MEKNHIKHLIFSYTLNHDMTIADFCRACGVSKYLVEKLMKGDIRVGVLNVLKIVNVLKITCDEFLKDFI